MTFPPPSYIVGGFNSLADAEAYLAGDRSKLLPTYIPVQSTEGIKVVFNENIHYVLEFQSVSTQAPF